MAAVPTSVVGLESLIVNKALHIIESAVHSLEAESTAHAERIDSVEASLSERLEESHQELLEKIESVQETLISQLAEASSVSGAAIGEKCTARLKPVERPTSRW